MLQNPLKGCLRRPYFTALRCAGCVSIEACNGLQEDFRNGSRRGGGTASLECSFLLCSVPKLYWEGLVYGYEENTVIDLLLSVVS